MKLIKTLDDLIGIESNGNYVLANDIDCKNANMQYLVDDFKGVLDGKGFTVRNINLVDEVFADGQSIALFYTMFRATIKNVRFENVNIKLDNEQGYELKKALLCSNASESKFENIVFISHNDKILPLIYDSNTCVYKNVKNLNREKETEIIKNKYNDKILED